MRLTYDDHKALLMAAGVSIDTVIAQVQILKNERIEFAEKLCDHIDNTRAEEIFKSHSPESVLKMFKKLVMDCV